MKLSIIIPVYNESSTVLSVINKVRNVNTGTEKEIIVIDGASTDGTQEVLRNEAAKSDLIVIFEDKREGKGAAVRKGFEAATGDYIIIQDGDLELSPDEFPSLLRPLIEDMADAVYGSRFYNGKGKLKIINYAGNYAATQAINLLFFTNFTDTQTGYKLFKKDLLQGITLHHNGFTFDTEITLRFIEKKIRFTEVPVKYEPRTVLQGKKLQLRIGFLVLYNIIKFRFTGRL